MTNPARRYISAKSRFGTVSVPSISKTTPRNGIFGGVCRSSLFAIVDDDDVDVILLSSIACLDDDDASPIADDAKNSSNTSSSD